MWQFIYSLRFFIFVLALFVALQFLISTTRVYVREEYFIFTTIAVSVMASLFLWNRFSWFAWLVVLQGFIISCFFLLLAQDRYQGGVNTDTEGWFFVFLGLMFIHGCLLFVSLFVRWRPLTGSIIICIADKPLERGKDSLDSE